MVHRLLGPYNTLPCVLIKKVMLALQGEYDYQKSLQTSRYCKRAVINTKIQKNFCTDKANYSISIQNPIGLIKFLNSKGLSGAPTFPLEYSSSILCHNNIITSVYFDHLMSIE